MTSPSDFRRGSTGEHPVAGVSPPGSSIIHLSVAANPDERPTIITGPRPAASLSTLITGQTLGHFELLEPIGRGGMATVIKARDLELGRFVALKILPPETATDSEVVSRFKQEGRAAAKLDHDHIARVYFCGEDRGLYFIAFEFVAGDNLRVVMDRSGTLNAADAVRYLIHVAAGLKHASERGVVHRDIKPSNIIITPDGQAKIVDMGLARHLESHSINGGVTQSGVTLGTFDYISPEQALDPRRADVRSDIYSLGCTFYHALTGRPPVPEGTAARKLQAHQHEAPLDPRDLNPAIPDELAMVMARMMAKDPGRRQQTADELLLDLAGVAIQCRLPVEGLPVDPSVLTSTRSILTKPPKVPVAWVIAASVAVIALAILLGRPDRKSGPMVPPWGESASAAKLPAELPAVASHPAVFDSTMKTILTATELADTCRNSDTVKLHLKPGITYDLTAIPQGLSFSGSTFVLETETNSGLPPPVLRISAAAAGEYRDRSAGAMTFRNCRDVRLQGITIVIVSPVEENIAMTNPVAILFDKVETVAIDGCRFMAEADVRDDQITGLAANAGQFTVTNTLVNFGEQNIAFALREGSTLTIADSAFAPHRMAISVGGEAESEATPLAIRVTSSTFMIERGGTTFRIHDKARMQIDARYSLFAGLPGIETAAPGAVLTADDTAVVKFESSLNAYYRVALPAAIETTTRLLHRSPWNASDPHQLLSGSDPAAAFRLSLNDPRLRLPTASGAVIVGVKALGHPETRIYPGPWPPERPQMVKAAANERIVLPDADADDAAMRVYGSFAMAYAALQPGETLTLAVNGPLPIPPLPEKTLKCTLKAATGFHPILVPEGPGFTVDATLFKLADGELTFENLEVRLKDRQSIVSAAGGTSCTFRGCIITLTEKDDHPAAAVVIPDPAREMKLPAGTDETGPKIRFEDCIVRGDGRGLWVQSARPFELTLENTALALEGIAVLIDASDKPAGTELPKVALKLKRVTAVLTGAFLELKTGRTAGGTPATVTVDVDGCLFASADARATATPLVLFDDVEANADVAKYITWGGRGTVYSFSDTSAAVEWRSANDMMTGSWDWPAWLRFARDEGRLQPRVRFAKGSLKSKLTTAVAADFELSSLNAMDAGADVKKLHESK
ncbi:hypothetical protein BH11PLA2_BH11PLA2_32010 [soil metagenome]